MSPPDSDDGTDGSDDRRWHDLALELPLPSFGGNIPDAPSVSALRSEFEALVTDARPDPAGIERAVADLDGFGLSDADVEATIHDASVPVDADHVDGVVRAGGETVAVAAETDEDAARVVLDAGDEAVEVAVDGADGEAAEAVLEVVAAALDGL